MMLRAKLLALMGACFLLTSLPTAVGGSAAAKTTTTTTTTALGDRRQQHQQQLTLDGSDDAAADDFEFDLDVSSKEKLKRLQQRLSEEDEADAVEVVTTPAGESYAWAPPVDVDYSTKVEPSGFNYGRGTRYVATREIDEGDVLFSVPFVDVMDLHSARQGRIKALLDANPELPASIAMAVHLLEEKFRGESSRFHGYIETLPGGAALNSTLFYSEDEMELLRGSHLHRLTTSRAQGVNSIYDALVGPVTSLAIDPPLFTPDQFTKENFAWAMGTVWARTFSLTANDSDAFLAPMLDTIGVCVDEACPPSRVEWDRELQRVVVYATQDYAAGEEVLVNVGDHKSSTLLMLTYGFARSQTFAAAETYDLSIYLDPNDTLIDVKTHVLESHNMSMNGSYTLRYKSKHLDARLAASLKVKLLTAAELDKYPQLLASAVGDGVDVPIVSLRNEYVFTRAVVSACKNLLAKYPTTLDHDRAKLRELETHYGDRRTGVADRTLHILRALVVEKEILHHAMGLATAHWSNLLTHAEPAFLGA